ncbi:MAG: SatD family protein [Saccharospirillum sp.]|nr:SatD family protein [Saccharospirillum sp.]
MKHLVLIADIVASRQLPDRKAVQQQLRQCLAELNQHHSGLVSPYTITLGDEFQAVFASADGVFKDITHIMVALSPVRIRFALAVGEITTAINPDQAIGMDGPAFYLARAGIEGLKKIDELLAIGSDDEHPCELLSASLALLNHHLTKWKTHRFDTLLGLMSEQPVAEIARRLDVSEQAVYKNIRTGGLEAVQAVFQALTEAINRDLAKGVLSEKGDG